MAKIIVQEKEITILTVENEDYISLTDMLKAKDGDFFISDWLRNRNTIEYLGIWEKIHNPDFNYGEFAIIKSQAGLNSYKLSVKEWSEKTNAIGLVAKAGRYGGTYAHKDIAFEFGSWLSPEFKLYLIKEFQRLKEHEAQQTSIEWQVKRELSKVNYRLQTDAVQMNLLEGLPKARHGFVYANEADVINTIVFGKTHKEWQTVNSGLKGNQRDYGTALDNAIIANLEFQNSLLINQKYSLNDRIKMLKDLEETSYKLATNPKSVGSDNNSLVLSGGEPGLLSTEEILQVIHRIHPNVELSVNTNGLFLQKIDTKIFELMVRTFKAFNIRWHLFEDSSCILEDSMSGIELARKFIVYQDYLPYIEFQMLFTDKEIANNLIDSYQFKDLLKMFKGVYPKFKLIVTPDHNLTNKLGALQVYKKINTLNHMYKALLEDPRSDDIIDIEPTRTSFNSILNFEKKEQIKFKNGPLRLRL